MRLWVFNFDGTIAKDEINHATTQLDPVCNSLLRKLSDCSSDQVVVVSKRNIYDIAERIDIPGVIVGGCDGIEWKLPSGYRIGPFKEYEDDLIRCRLKILPEISKVVSDHGIGIEDKLWSIAVDTSRLKYNAWIKFEKNIRAWAMKLGLTVSSGLNHIDVQLIPGFNKSVGISYLALMLKIDPTVDSIIYAGDDESDVVALWWTLLFGGTAIMVGSDLHVPGAIFAKDSETLISLVDNIIGDV